ncbi:uncharacterized protein MONOS_4098 [Monocercomonoides exilis]|uniref:uncharacterized protein n=1 Tax=Monocercomonoides exilis TaxID=2049356 RepID=UPI00355A0E57|nr:hypothetical protein MONOS_4098 [Monocercomonoides exilis]|eukprot:MONOS_4098.1-p1 / transcript=MONOS_4098.1 / gene=MONOS_4098 / organism=Monocercomonoides_exilis_PA203 / gene_product=unspecified product / transcript_product=unspecified product / location=Mono_scaffold00104:69055-69579(-) / protein_length=175 / sequence_SO=supercontig / SO=protein_coding / is_pseudo=false
MIGSQLLKLALSAVSQFQTLFVKVVDPQHSNGDWVMLFPLKKTSFPLPFVAELPSKKQKVMNFVPLIQGNVTSVKIPAPPRVEDVPVNLLFMSWQSSTKNCFGLSLGGYANVKAPTESPPEFAMHLHFVNKNLPLEDKVPIAKYQPIPHQFVILQLSTLFSEDIQTEFDNGTPR